MITSFSNNRVKLTHALQNQSKARRKEGKIALEGARLVRDAVERGGLRPDFVLYEPDSAEPGLIDLLERRNIEVQPVSAEVMRHISDTETPQGVVGVVAKPDPTLPAAPERLLILDQIRDPGNLGTLLRTAAAAEVDGVVLAPGCVDAYNTKALRAGMGAHFRVTVIDCDWGRIADLCHDLTVYIADMQGDVTYDAANWSAAWALIIGSEAHGTSPDAERIGDQRVYIPMAADSESLNAAIAAGILLFEARRQRKN